MAPKDLERWNVFAMIRGWDILAMFLSRDEYKKVLAYHQKVIAKHERKKVRS